MLHVDEGEYSFKYTYQEVQEILPAVPLRKLIYALYLKYIAHVCGYENSAMTKGSYLQRRRRNTFGLKIADI